MFWRLLFSTFLRIPVMPFWQAAIPWLIKGGAALGTSLLGSKLAGGPSTMEKSVLDVQMDNLRRSQQLGREAQPMGLDMYRMAGRGLGSTADYYARLLSGNRAAATGVLAPQLNQMADQYRAAQQSMGALTPRGGGRASVMAQLPYQQVRGASELYQALRPQAAQGLGQTGAAMGNLGSGLLQNAITAMYGSTAAGKTILDYEAARRQSAQAFGAGLGGMLFNAMQGQDFGFGGGKGGGINLGTSNPLADLQSGKILSI